MGIDPGNDDYPSVLACSHCDLPAFGGNTPEFIEAIVEGVTICPGFAGSSPNGIFLLTQVAACTWEVFAIGYLFRLILSVANSTFVIQTGVSIVFNAGTGSACGFSFSNINIVCSLPFAVGIGGSAEMFWGPGIEP